MHKFKNPSLRDQALTHRSYNNRCNNQRLEFLGDSILGHLVAEALYDLHPDWDEGKLSQAKSHLTSAPILAEMAREMGLDREMKSAPSFRDFNTNCLCDLMEAYLAAVYKDGGWGAAKNFFIWAVGNRVREVEPYDHSHKARYQIVVQKLGFTPDYEVLSEEGPADRKVFTIRAVYKKDGVVMMRYPPAKGYSKKEAANEAARLAVNIINQKGGGM